MLRMLCCEIRQKGLFCHCETRARPCMCLFRMLDAGDETLAEMRPALDAKEAYPNE